MKLTFIVPKENLDYSDFPMGVLYVASYIKDKIKDTEINIFDEKIESFIIFLNNYKPQIIGIFCNVTNVDIVQKYVSIIRRFNKDIKIILGGPATVSSLELLKSFLPDFIVVGEGEISTYKIVEAINKNKDFKNIENIIFKKNNKYIETKRSEKRLNLEKLELPNFNLINVNKYIKKWFYFDYYNDIKGISLIISRGCPYNCNFCQPTLKKIFGNKVRYHSPENIVNKIEELKKDFKINSIFFHDDTFTMNSKFVRDLCNLIISKKLNIIWGCNSRVDCINDELCKIMYNAGCREIRLGIESFNKKTLQFLNKNIEEKRINSSLIILKKNKINSLGFIIIGSPNESFFDIIKTLMKCTFSNLNFIRISILTNLPGTNLNDIIKTKNLGNENYNYIKNTKNICSKLSIKKLEFLKLFGYIIFYFNPKRFIYLVKMNNSIKKIKYKLERL